MRKGEDEDACRSSSGLSGVRGEQRGHEPRHEQQTEEARAREPPPHGSVPIAAGSLLGAGAGEPSAGGARRTRIPTMYSAPPTRTATTTAARFASRLDGSSARTAAHMPTPIGAAMSTARASPRGAIDRPVRRARPTPRTSEPTAYALVWPRPMIATVVSPDVSAPPNAMTPIPTTAAAIATIAGVLLSPSA